MSKENNNGTVPLSYEQERALELMLSGRNVFLTGEAGTGKSAIIHEFKRHKSQTGKTLSPVRRRGGSEPPVGCRCQSCGAPRKYLYMNNGKFASQVSCKVCGATSPTHRVRRESKAKYWCPHCQLALSVWKESATATIYKCFSAKCPHYLRNIARLTTEERGERETQKYNPNYKLHYQYREYHLDVAGLKTARPNQESAKVDLKRIHNNYQVVGLVLTFMINLGLSSRMTRDALRGIFDIKISHQTVINYANAAANILAPLVDLHSPKPKGVAAADETYIIVEGKWRYTWFVIDSASRAICGYNLSETRGTEPALALLRDCYGEPDGSEKATMVTDGNPSYDSAVMAYNAEIPAGSPTLNKKTVIGLENLDPTSAEYRQFKQLVERLNRTYKYHTRPRSGFKSFDGAVNLTTLFVAYYNFTRPHSALKRNAPVRLDCLKGGELMPEAWITLLKEAA
jgi:transposase-like protein